MVGTRTSLSPEVPSPASSVCASITLPSKLAFLPTPMAVHLALTSLLANNAAASSSRETAINSLAFVDDISSVLCVCVCVCVCVCSCVLLARVSLKKTNNVRSRYLQVRRFFL